MLTSRDTAYSNSSRHTQTRVGISKKASPLLTLRTTPHIGDSSRILSAILTQA
jgi:hypothetical protein